MTRFAKIIGGVAVGAALLGAGIAVACDGPWMGPGGGRYGGGSAASLRKFQSETLGLRDDLAAKQIDLAEEYDKATPDAARIAALRKDVVDLEAKIEAAAGRHGMQRWARGQGHGSMGGWGGSCGCW